MKKFKAIYYSVLSVLTVLMLVLGFVAASVPYNTAGGVKNSFASNVKTHLKTISAENHSATDELALSKVRSYITDQLAEAGIQEQTVFTEDDDELYGHTLDCDYAIVEGKPAATFFVQSDVLSSETLDAVNKLRSDDKIVSAVGREINNIIVAIPGKRTVSGQTGDAIIMTAHYDSMPKSNGASDNGVSVAAMLEAVKSLTAKKAFKNDLVFVFTDAEEEGAYGAYAFRYQFKGFDDVYSRAKLGINFNGMGTNGAIALFEESGNVKLVSALNSKVGGIITDSAFGYIYSRSADTSDFAIFDDINALNLSNIGNVNEYHTSLDTVKRVSDSQIKAKANLIDGVISAFGSFNLNELQKGNNGVYFSYLGFFNVSYSYTLAYVLGGIVLAVLLAALIINIFKKAFSYLNLLSGMGVQITSLVSAGLATLAIYFLSSLLLVGFGAIPLRAITSVHYINAGMIVGGMILFFALLSVFYYIYKRMFRIKSADIVRGSAVLFAVVGAVLSFAVPKLSYMFAIAGLLEAVVLLITVLLKDKFRVRFGMDMERLFLYALPMILIALPMLAVFSLTALKLVPTVWLCLVLVVFGAMLGSIAPYCDFVIPAFNALMKKLPKRTIRVERTVVEQIEDKAKKGKFTTQEVKKVTNEKIEWRYRHGVGLSIVAIIATVVFMLSAAFSADFGTAYAGSFGYSQSIYKDSLLYVWEKDGSEVTESIEVHDHIAYKYMRKALDELKWNANKKAYVKDFTGNTSNILTSEPSFEVSDGKIVFNPYNGADNSQIKVRLLDASDIDSVTVISASGEEFKILNDEGRNVIEIIIPYGNTDYNTFKLAVESKYSQVDVEYEQYVFGTQADNTLKNNLDDWNIIRDYFEDEGFYDLISCGMMLKLTRSVSV